MSDPIRDMDKLWYEDNFGHLWGARLVDGELIPTGRFYRAPEKAPWYLRLWRWMVGK